jgi:hypothetical protein
MKRVRDFELELDEEHKALSSADSPLFGSNVHAEPELDNQSHGKMKSPVPPDTYLPCHYFDYIGGTSVGGLVSPLFYSYSKSS